ncbi:HAD family hydrolase [Paenibacillus sp. URB8-2]|uniref:HAD family hydrolase n=1 Tax=Paenibacillus sp. URB8-2 TaxID=2741301 RepID=UPI0015BE4DAC|nr:HAD family phosphatase [Paenibacillus sp. URB8-2]BCG59443.1 phosphatase [Paenibacillus sp. URB8-2]
MRFKAVIFDKDGVIIDTQPIHYRVFCEFCDKFSWNITKSEYESYIGTTSIEMFHRIKKRYSSNIDVSELVDMFQDRYLAIIESLKDERPILGVDILIKQLYSNGIQLAVASSATRRKIKLVLNMFNLSTYFRSIVSGYEVERSKPSPDIFLRAAKDLNIHPEECIVIEDSTNGIFAAKAAGMRSIGYQNPLGQQDLSMADYTISNFNELIESEFSKGIFGVYQGPFI